jgi:hypothetical protein
MKRSKAWRRSQNKRVFAKRKKMVKTWIRRTGSNKTPETFFTNPNHLYVLRDTPKTCSSLEHGCGNWRKVVGPPPQEERERLRGRGWRDDEG